MNKSDRYDRCPDEDTDVCDTCNPNEDTSAQDQLMTEISDKFFTLRNIIRKKHFGESTNDDIKQISLELSEKCRNLAAVITNEAGTESEQIELTYTFTISGGICAMEGLHINLDTCVMAMITDLGYDLLKSSLESPDEIIEHDYQKEVFDE